MIENRQGQEHKWYRTFVRRFTAFDILILVIGAALGFAGNAIFSGQTSIVFGLVTLAMLAIAATLAVDRLGARAERDLAGANDSFRQELSRHYDGLEDRLRSHLNQVHASVQFVADERWAQQGVAARPSYDIAKAAVRKATRRIWSIGDYSPPADHGAELDRNPPKNRSSYFRAIEEKLKERHESGENLPILQYRRYIQRPVGLYTQIASRGTAMPGITLTRTDMQGDLQAFDHCARVLQIAAAASTDNPPRIQVDLRLIPFLPNCPSILIVDEHDVQLIVPTRIDGPGDDFADQALLGILALQDKARGSSISWPFIDLFQRLSNFSVPIIKVEGAAVPGVEVAPVEPPPVQILADGEPHLAEG